MSAKKTWFIPDCYWPEGGTDAPYVSHESICVLNPSGEDAQLAFTLYFEDREPMEGFTAICGARRCHHVRMDRQASATGQTIPRGVPYAVVMVSNVAVWVQYSRCDTTQTNMAFMTAIPMGE